MHQVAAIGFGTPLLIMWSTEPLFSSCTGILFILLASENQTCIYFARIMLPKVTPCSYRPDAVLKNNNNSGPSVKAAFHSVLYCALSSDGSDLMPQMSSRCDKTATWPNSFQSTSLQADSQLLLLCFYSTGAAVAPSFVTTDWLLSGKVDVQWMRVCATVWVAPKHTLNKRSLALAYTPFQKTKLYLGNFISNIPQSHVPNDM